MQKTSFPSVGLNGTSHSCLHSVQIALCFSLSSRLKLWSLLPEKLFLRKLLLFILFTPYNLIRMKTLLSLQKMFLFIFALIIEKIVFIKATNSYNV